MCRTPAKRLHSTAWIKGLSPLLRCSTNTITFTQEKIMLAIVKPFVLSALRSPKFKIFVVELLEKLVEQSDNELDDKALAIVKKGLGL